MIRRIVFERHGSLRTDLLMQNLPFRGEGHHVHSNRTYVLVVMDLYARRIVGWCFQSKLDASIATNALAMVIHQRKTTPGLLVHSDRGTQFTSDAFQKQLADNKFVQRLSRKGDCWHTAAMESFFGTLKQELVYRVTYET